MVEEPVVSKEEKIVEDRALKVKNYLRDNTNLILVIILGFAIALRLYYFFKLGVQPIWWDEGDYLGIAKIWATGQPRPEWWGSLTGIRPLLLPLIWVAMFKIGFSELIIRFVTLLIPSIFAICFIYALGNSLYNKRVGVMAAVMMSFYWVWMFYSFRLLTDIPAVFFGILSLYFFWAKYIKENKPYGLYLCYLFGIVAFSIRFPLGLVPATCVAYLLFVKKLSLFKDKTFWKSVMWGIIFCVPYLVYFIIDKFAAFAFYFGPTSVSIHQPIGWWLLPFIFNLLHLGWQAAFVVGLISLYPLFLYGDLIWKQKETKFNADLFVVIGLFLHLFFYVIIFRDGNDRWLLMLMPYIFFISGKGLDWTYNILKKYGTTIAWAVVLVLLLGGAYQNFTHANGLIEQKKDTYLEVKEAGLWLKENTLPGTKIITASIVQNQYYSERPSYDLTYNNTLLIEKGCLDKYGATNKSDYCQNLSEGLFEEKVDKIKPDYYIVSIFEPVFTPDWAYTYAQRHNLTAVQAYAYQGTNQPALVIYKLKK